MPKVCSYALCNSDSRYPERHPGVHFIPFPKPNRHFTDCKIWIRACYRPHSHLNPSKINKETFVCSRHFHDPRGPTEEYPYPIPYGGFSAKRARNKRKANDRVRKIRHTCHADIWNSVKKLSSEAKGNWIFYGKGKFVVAEQHLENAIIPRLRLEFDEYVYLHNLYLFGWNVPVSIVAVDSLRVRRLSTFLTDIESIRMCEGMSKKLIRWNIHPINMLKDNRIVTRDIIRSPDCVIIAGSSLDMECSKRCIRCIDFEKWAVSQLRIDKDGFEKRIFQQLNFNDVSGRFCCAIGCNKKVSKMKVRSDSDGSTDEDSSEKRRWPRTLFLFPRDPALKHLWLENMQRHGWIPSPGDGICSDHFSEVNIVRSGNRIQLLPNAIPTRFKCLRKVDRLCSAYGCNKICKGKFLVRSDSEGSSDEESAEKRKYPRTFHRFPTDPYLKRLWLVNMRRKDWIPTDDTVICSDHFQEKDLFRNQQIAVLRPTAVPTRFKACGKPSYVDIHGLNELPTDEVPTLPGHSKEDKRTQATNEENAFSVMKMPAAYLLASVSKLPTALENIKFPPPTSQTALPAEIERSPCAVCSCSIALDHTYAYPTCPKIMRTKFKGQEEQIQSWQKSSTRLQRKYRRLRVRFDRLERKCERKRHRRLNCEMRTTVRWTSFSL